MVLICDSQTCHYHKQGTKIEAKMYPAKTRFPEHLGNLENDKVFNYGKIMEFKNFVQYHGKMTICWKLSICSNSST